jgi:hypothetical protein
MSTSTQRKQKDKSEARNMDRYGQIWTNMDKSEARNMDRYGQVWTGLDRPGRVIASSQNPHDFTTLSMRRRRGIMLWFQARPVPLIYILDASYHDIPNRALNDGVEPLSSTPPDLCAGLCAGLCIRGLSLLYIVFTSVAVASSLSQLSLFYQSYSLQSPLSGTLTLD